MNTKQPNDLRLTALAACVSACWPLLVSSALAATHKVANCNDSGTGSLRAVVGAATTDSGDTIDMTQLMCSPISLDTGISITQSDLTINGPGESALNIVRNSTSVKHRIFRHTGGGTLTLTDMTVADGNVDDDNNPPGIGGCIYAFNLELNHVTVKNCTATSATHAAGGGIYTNNLTIHHSTISGNTISISNRTFPSSADGGGIHVSEPFIATDSTISNNSAVGGLYADGGGVHSRYAVMLTASTISGNHSDGRAGGMYLSHRETPSYTPESIIVNSTISGNDAAYAGGIYSQMSLILENSTVVANTADAVTRTLYGNHIFNAAGVALSSRESTIVLDMESSLLANNVYGAHAYDIDLSTENISSNVVTVSGADNLVRGFHGTEPANTKNGCPLLSPLRDNGGETKTRALLSGSPGIGAGNNVAGLNFDQRRSPFIRNYGGKVDIGAYEVQAEIIFNSGFNGCAALMP